MSNTEMNRQIVQEGLDCKKAARKQRMTDAAHDAAERQLRATINQRSQERRDAIEAAEAEARRREALRMQRCAERAREDADVKRSLRFTTRICDSLIYAAIATICFSLGAISAGVAFVAIGLSTVYCIATFVKYATRINRERRTA